MSDPEVRWRCLLVLYLTLVWPWHLSPTSKPQSLSFLPSPSLFHLKSSFSGSERPQRPCSSLCSLSAFQDPGVEVSFFLSFLASSWKEKLRGDLAVSHLLRTRILGVSRGEQKMRRRHQERQDQHRLALQTAVFPISHKENRTGSNPPSLTLGNILGGLYAFLVASSFTLALKTYFTKDSKARPN